MQDLIFLRKQKFCVVSILAKEGSMMIAVLMSTYNGEAYLSRQLESLASQTVADDMTVYIRDDGSIDGTEQIVKNWSNRLAIRWIPGGNMGPARSFWSLLMNKDIQADYYAFCDQDDVWDPDRLEWGIAQLGNGVHLSLCNCRLIDSEGSVLKNRMYDNSPYISIIRQFVCGVMQGCAMVFTDELRKYFLNQPIQCIPMHDTVVGLHALGFGSVCWGQEPKFGYRLHGKNVVAKKNKSLISRVKTTWWNWKNSSKNSMADVAAELLRAPLSLTAEDRRYLTCVVKYKVSFRCKLYILQNMETRTVPFAAKRSYILRVLLNLY